MTDGFGRFNKVDLGSSSYSYLLHLSETHPLISAYISLVRRSIEKDSTGLMPCRHPTVSGRKQLLVKDLYANKSII